MAWSGSPTAKTLRSSPASFLQDLYLREIDVLKFVYQDEAGFRPLASSTILLQQLVGVGDHVAEGAEVVFAAASVPPW